MKEELKSTTEIGKKRSFKESELPDSEKEMQKE